MTTHRINMVILVILFAAASAFVLSFPYPLHILPNGMWDGGTIPDEHSYFGWAWIYYTLKRPYVLIEEVGRDKSQYLDFYVGNSPEDCIFLSLKIVGSGAYWKSPGSKIKHTLPRSNFAGFGKHPQQPVRVVIFAYDGYGRGIAGLKIEIRSLEKKIEWKGITDEMGKITVELPPGRYDAAASDGRVTLHLMIVTDFTGFDYPILVTPKLLKWSVRPEVVIHVDHLINKNLSNVEITIKSFGEEIKGYTDQNGNFVASLPSKERIYRLNAVKETLNILPPVASVVVNIDGRYGIANRWYPGYSFMLIPFWLTNSVNLINIFNSAIASLAVYILARRLYDETTAFVAASLLMTSGAGLMMIYSRGMGDYASMAFSTLGIALFVISLHERTGKRILLALIAALSLGFAVAVRYSTVVVIVAPLLYLAVEFRKRWGDKTKSGEIIVPVTVFFTALSIAGVLIALYNTFLFGSPLSSGYQMPHIIRVSDGVVYKTAGGTMISRFFHPSVEAIVRSLDQSLNQMLLLLTPLFIAPLAILLDPKKLRTWMLLVWGTPVLFIYLQLGTIGNPPYEEMRYFLPSLPPACLLSARVITYVWQKFSIPAFLSFVCLIALGLISANSAIYWQLHRRIIGPVFDPPVVSYLIAFAAVICLYLLLPLSMQRDRKLRSNSKQ